MANLTLYRDFYCINHTAFNSADTYTLITPISLSANSYVLNSTALTETLVVYNESVGKYYVNLNPVLYSFDNVYELVWSVVYNSFSPTKNLITRFRLNPNNIASPFDVEIVSPSYGIEVEIMSPSFGTEIEIIANL
jgi:spermidine/putrescine-binding protein